MTRALEEIVSAYNRSTLITDAETVTQAISRMAKCITRELETANPLVLCVMNGGLAYCGRLLGSLLFPLELDYVHVARYGDRIRGGSINWLAKPHRSLTNRQVLLVDDVLDEGITLQALRQWALAEGAARVWTTVLVRKSKDRNAAVHVDFKGLECPDFYLFGCGMDYRGYWRNLPAVYALPHDQEKTD